MKKIAFFALLGVLVFTSCKKNDMTTTDDDMPEMPEVTATVEWSKRYIVNRPLVIQNAYQLSDGSFVAFCKGGPQAYIMKFSPEGDTTLSQNLLEFDRSTFQDFEWFRLMEDETYMAFDSNKIKKFDQEFNLIWEVDFGIDNNYQGKQFLATADNGFLIQRSNNQIAKYDENGALQWESTIGEINMDYIILEMVQTADLGFIILNGEYDGLEEQGTLIKVNAAGEFQWKTVGFIYSSAIRATSDNGVMVMSQTKEPPPSCSSGTMLEVQKVDQNGASVWKQEKIFDACRSYHSEQDIVEYNGYYIIGYTLEKYFEETTEFITRVFDANTGEALERINHGFVRNIHLGGGRLKQNCVGPTNDGYFIIKSKYIDVTVSEVLIEKLKVE